MSKYFVEESKGSSHTPRDRGIGAGYVEDSRREESQFQNQSSDKVRLRCMDDHSTEARISYRPSVMDEDGRIPVHRKKHYQRLRNPDDPLQDHRRESVQAYVANTALPGHHDPCQTTTCLNLLGTL